MKPPPRALGWGATAAIGLLFVYVALIAVASGIPHLAQQLQADWPWIATIVSGFGVQMTLLVTLHQRRHARAASAIAGAGAGASMVGMLACCAHHLAEIAPIVGANIAATFLTTYRTAFMASGIAVNLIAIGFTVRALRSLQPHHNPQMESPCVH